MRNFESLASNKHIQNWWNLFSLITCILQSVWMLILNFHNNFSNLLSRLVCSVLNKRANQKDLVRFLTFIFIISGFAISLYLIFLIHSVLEITSTWLFSFAYSKHQNVVIKKSINVSNENTMSQSVVFELIKTNKLNVYPH